MSASEKYAIVFSGDAMGGSRDEIRIVTEEVARSYKDVSGWTRAVKLTIEELN